MGGCGADGRHGMVIRPPCAPVGKKPPELFRDGLLILPVLDKIEHRSDESPDQMPKESVRFNHVDEVIPLSHPFGPQDCAHSRRMVLRRSTETAEIVLSDHFTRNLLQQVHVSLPEPGQVKGRMASQHIRLHGEAVGIPSGECIEAGMEILSDGLYSQKMNVLGQQLIGGMAKFGCICPVWQIRVGRLPKGVNTAVRSALSDHVDGVLQNLGEH